jgi:hypothetical protein
MTVTSIDINSDTLARAKELTGARSAKDVVDLALRRLIASKQKKAMIDGIGKLRSLPDGLGAPTIDYPVDYIVPARPDATAA